MSGGLPGHFDRQMWRLLIETKSFIAATSSPFVFAWWSCCFAHCDIVESRPRKTAQDAGSSDHADVDVCQHGRSSKLVNRTLAFFLLQSMPQNIPKRGERMLIIQVCRIVVVETLTTSHKGAKPQRPVTAVSHRPLV